MTNSTQTRTNYRETDIVTEFVNTARSAQTALSPQVAKIVTMCPLPDNSGTVGR